jgi:hypothetical protein
VQQRTLWSIDLYKSDASVNLFLHNGNETQLGQRFPGVTATDLSSPNSETFAFDYSLRIERSDPLWSIYIESDLNYGHKASHTPQNTYQRSETADYFYHEVGLAPNLWPRHRNASTLKLLLPAAFRTQVWPTITQITPGFDTAGAKSITTEAPNLSYTLSLRPGLRFDYVKPKPDNPFALPGAGQAKAQPGTPQIQTGQFWTSYIEGGYEVGRVLNGPSAFQFNYPGVASPTVCAVTAVQFIPCLEVAPASTAAAPATATVLAGRNHSQAGFYLDFRFDAPVPRLPTVEFLVENRGDFYVFGRPEDTPVDTRLYNDLKASLVIPIPGLYKLSLSPTFEWIVYRNRIIDNTYYGVNAFVSLSYSFGWRQGLEWRKVLGFSNPTPALSTLPTR